MRQIAVAGHYLATASDAGIQIHQYASANVDARVGEGRRVALRLETDYPWDGRVRATVEEADGGEWSLSLRVPGWCEGASLCVNGQASGAAAAGGTYATVGRAWQPGDVVELELPMPPRLVQPNPRIDAIRGSLAIERGPMVYCLEGIDQPDVSLLDVAIAPNAPLEAVEREGLLGGVVAVEVQGSAIDVGPWGEQLYRPAPVESEPGAKVALTAVPYYAWANRGAGEMRVWIPRQGCT
jgi:DUF1680 family protein